jgi:hypothetical protein
MIKFRYIAEEPTHLLVIEKAMQLKSKEELKRQIKDREDMIGQMVGWLYPSILRDEITRLRERIAVL